MSEHGKTVLMVTHDPVVARQAHTTLHLEKGVLVEAGARQGAVAGGVGMKFSRLILANLFRKKVRLILTIGSFAVALFLFALSRRGERRLQPRSGRRERRIASSPSIAPPSSTPSRCLIATKSCAFRA